MKSESLATKFVRSTYVARYVTVLIGFVLSITLIWLGYTLTQQELDIKTINSATESEISLDFKATKFALKNTAPGLLLIICGTVIALTTIRKTTWVKSQWSDKENAIPGYTESKG